MDRPRAYVEDLEFGKPYIESNPWHWDCEYGIIWYVGTSYNKYDEKVFCFSEREVDLPEDFDGDANSIIYTGPIYTVDEIDAGSVALCD